MNNSKGSALWEALPVTAVLATFVAVFLLAGYLFFARTMIFYQVEQALYCAVVQAQTTSCKIKFVSALKGPLPWGQLRWVTVIADSKQANVSGEWAFGKYQIPFHQSLVPERAGKRVSSWSAWSP